MKVQKHQENVGILGITVKTRKGAKMKIVLYLRLIQITANVFINTINIKL